ncbi:hypothetical protein J1614_005320 [Plenodomus biglobosus]|nr:hypothetical protein J1614_005320 [Plenodomus biglobosus]
MLSDIYTSATSDGLKVCIPEDAVDTKILGIRSVAVSSIRIAGPAFTPFVFKDPKEITRAVVDSYALARRDSFYKCENDMIEAFIATLCAEKNGNADPIESDQSFIDDFVLFLTGQDMNDVVSGTSLSVLLASGEAMNLPRAISTNMEEWAMNRRLIITADSLLGLAPMNSKTGDSLVILFGSFAPWLLREDIDSWKLIGGVYSNHVMKVCDGV